MGNRLALIAALAFLFGSVCPQATAEIHEVRLVDFMFEPMDVTIREGDSVRWIWTTDNHNIVSGLPFAADGTFQTTVENTGYSFEVRFDRLLLNKNRVTNNKYEYYCVPHLSDNMLGSVTVTRMPKLFLAAPSAWQVYPPRPEQAPSDCSALLSADETQIDITCSHNVAGVTGIQLRQGTLGDSGTLLCQSAPGTSTTLTCALTPEQVDALVGAEFFIDVRTTEAPSGALRGQLVFASGTGSISGAVLTADGAPIPGATVSNGPQSAQSSANGTYTLPNVPNGVYRLTAQKNGLKLAPVRGASPIVVQSAALANRSFVQILSRTCGTDFDRDTYCDLDELASGTDPDDRGSFPQQLQNPTQVLWNSFLGMINILEVLNTGFSDRVLQIRVISPSGAILAAQTVSIPARSQRDIVLNGLAGFPLDSYGLIQLSESGNSTALDGIDGRMFFYRPAQAQGGEYEFVFSVPFASPAYGATAVGFNTFQPSTAAGEANNVVAQWLSVGSLSAFAERFTIARFDQFGTLLSSTAVELPPFGRRDFEAGHVSPGPQKVGLLTITPANSLAPYLAQLTRYGGDAPPNRTPSAYAFAFALSARPGSGQIQRVPISSGAGAANWLELVNASSQSTNVDINFFSNSGSPLLTRRIALAPHAQQHFDAASLLPPGGSGNVRVSPSRNDSLLGQSMFYFRNSSSGTIQAMYGSPLRESRKSEVLGSFNLFLGMYNWLRVTNTTAARQTFTLTVYPPGKTPTVKLLTLAPNSGRDLGLHDFAAFRTEPDTFGVISIESASEDAVLAELLRIRQTAGGQIDFAAPIPLR